MLDRPQPRDLQLLRGFPAINPVADPLVCRVVGLHRQQPSPAGHRLTHHRVVRDLETDHVGEFDRADPQHPWGVTGGEVPWDQREPADEPTQHAPERQVLTERYEVALDVDLPRSGLRRPDDRCVPHVLRAGAVEDRSDKDRHADRLDRAFDHRARDGIRRRIVVRGVLRPDHDVRLRYPSRGHVGSQRLGFGEVVGGHGATLGELVQPESGHVALDQCNDDV